MNATISKTKPNLLPFVCVGLNHHHTPVEVRERIAFGGPDFEDAAKHVASLNSIEEALILSTCNRVEIYAHGHPIDGPNSIEDFIHDYHSLQYNFLNHYLYRFTGFDALHQLCRVTASLDSQIIGEPQIHGQVKSAFIKAQKVGTAGPIIHQTFSHALSVAKIIRSETNIGKLAISTAYAATQLAEKVLGKIEGLNCLLIGAGQMAEIAAQHMRKKGANLLVANRSFDHAAELAARHNAKPFAIDSLSEVLKQADIVIASSGASDYLVTKSMAEKALKARRFKPTFFIDIAVPRNIDPKASNLDGIYVYDIDDLDAIVQQNQNKRDEAAESAMRIIDRELISFEKRFKERTLAPIVKKLKSHSLNVATLEVEKLLNSLGDKLNDSEREKVARMAYRIANKVLHEPLLELKKR